MSVHSIAPMDVHSLLDRIAKVEAENHRLMANQGQIILETNRKLQLHQQVERQLSHENKELRDLCCFLDDQRQKIRKLSKEWQDFARYTASVLKEDINTYQERLKLLEETQKNLVRENHQLAEQYESLKRSKSLCQSCQKGRSHRLSVPNFVSDDCEVHSTESGDSTGTFYGSIPSLTGRNLLFPRISDVVGISRPSEMASKPLKLPLADSSNDSGLSSGDSGEIEPTKGHLKSFRNQFDHTRSESHLNEVAVAMAPVASSTPNMSQNNSYANDQLLEKIKLLEDRVNQLEQKKHTSQPEIFDVHTEEIHQESFNGLVVTEEDWVSFSSSLATIEEADEEELLTQPETMRRRFVSKSEPNLSTQVHDWKPQKSLKYNSFALFGHSQDFDLDSVWDNFLQSGDDSVSDAFKVLTIEKQTASEDTMSDAEKCLIEQMCQVAWKTIELTPNPGGKLTKSSSMNLQLISTI